MEKRSDDPRVGRTIGALHAEFERMLCEMEYRQITVKALCERARVNKKTFYRYYETMDFLLAEFEEEMMADYLETVEGLRIPEDMDAISRGEIFERLTCAVPYERMQVEMTETVMFRHGGETASDPERSVLMAFVREATLAIYRQWVADGKRLSSEEVTELAAMLVCRGTDSFT
ncbi:TetR/AcrR family transcriptional regulator [Slackia exigua]|uniref:TetR/AcrR family transcriptional regulator n=1 Tax=Slackia exigua TaxID=84109 RepID=UPI0028DBE294|nr:TetR/AcrR family transcriptional regulator [Slackia exigua]